MIPTSLGWVTLDDGEVARAKLRIVRFKHTFHSLQTTLLKRHPIFRWPEHPVRPELFLCAAEIRACSGSPREMRGKMPP